jgi:hypothetical protein
LTTTSFEVCIQTVRQARERMKNKTSTVLDEVLVAQWDAVVISTGKQQELSEKLDIALRSTADYARTNDILESRLAKLSGQAMPLVPVH